MTDFVSKDKGSTGLGREDAIDALNLIQSSKISELYSSRDTEDPLVLRKKAADFRKGYKNWRQKKPKGARGESNYLTDKTKVHAHDAVEAEAEAVKEAMREAALGDHRKLSVDEDGEEAPQDIRLVRRNSFRRSMSHHLPDEDFLPEHETGEDWLKFYVNPFSGMGEAEVTEPIPLTQEGLSKIRSNVLKPMYDRPVGEAYVENYICHLGVGGFHRSHQCVYTDDLLNAGIMPRWGICGIGLMPWDFKMYQALAKQDNLYTVLSRSPAVPSEARVIGSIVDYKFAPDDHQAAVDKLVDASTKIVSLTVTEKGYCTDNDGNLDPKNSLIAHDLESNLATPSSAIGIIVAALKARRDQKIPSFTVLSCDNLPENGDKIKHVILQMAELIEPKLRDWIALNTTFPNTMVDRITPLTEQEHRDILARDYMVDDEWPVIAEGFSQWVIEDNFCYGRPEWDQVGAMLVDDVKPYEFMKLRLLNGGHSALSYIGVLSGYTYVDDAMSDPVVKAILMGYFQEMDKTLHALPGVDVPTYEAKLIERFSNPYIKDKLARLAEDGSMKMLNTMRDGTVALFESGRPTRVIAVANACFVRYMTGVDEEDHIIPIKDPRASELTDLANLAVKSGDLVPFLRTVYGDKLADLAGFVEQVSTHLKKMLVVGAKVYLADFATTLPCSE